LTPVGTRSAPETALREQVLAQLRTIVAKAVDGSRLPTVRKLMADLGASQYVVQAALEQLREEGQIVSHVGRGTFKAGADAKAASQTRNVLSLLYHHPYERGDRIAEIVHRELIQRGHNSIVMTYAQRQ
jgi:DNA-binding transcriptional regulator YhcF (GntR family)